MNARERALMGPPTFPDLCEAVRAARIAHNRAIRLREETERRVAALRQAEELAADQVEGAEMALWRFIDRETALEEGEAA